MKAIWCDNLYQDKWEEFIKDNSDDFGLLQSLFWARFQESIGGKVFRLAILKGGTVSDDQILAVALVIKKSLKFGKSYFYIPRGPILYRDGASSVRTILSLLFSKIKKLAKKEGVVFLRFDPAWKDDEITGDILKEFGFQFNSHVQPKETLILNLDKSEEELLKSFKSKTRYNIKVAEKHGVKIDEGNNYFEDFWGLIKKTSSRQEIKPHPKVYYQKMIESLGDNVKLIVAKYQDRVVVANIVVFFGDWCVYLHGASDYEYRKIMAPYLLQWETIRLAKMQNKKYYDFWGVDEKKWPGVTRFKFGFSPNKEFTKYIGAWDEIYSKFWYNLYKLFRR